MKIIGICLVFFLGPVIIQSQNPGDLDPAFGEGGIQLISWASHGADLFGMDIQEDERLVAAGYRLDYGTGKQDILAVRLSPSGPLEPFGNNINFFQNNFNDLELATVIKVLPDGKILMAGSYSMEGYPFVTRLLQDGTVDPTFGVMGTYVTEAFSFVPICLSLVSTTEGYHILMGGYSMDFIPSLFMLDQDAIPVSSFGTDGRFTFPLLQGVFRDLAVDQQAGVLYTCGFDPMGTVGFATKHELSSGNLISGFGEGGYIKIQPFGDALSFAFRALVFSKEQEQLCLFGSYLHVAGDYDMCAYRIQSGSGGPDLTFGINGWSVLRQPVTSESLFDAVGQSDGKYYFGGDQQIEFINMYMIGRINGNGFLDPEFGTNGLVFTEIHRNNYLRKIVLNPNETRIFAGGLAEHAMAKEMAVASYFTGYSTGIKSSSRIASATVFPNPASDRIWIDLNLHDRLLLTISLCLPDGRRVYQLPAAMYTGGSHVVEILFPATMKSNLYFLSIESQGDILLKKIIIDR